MRKEIHWQFCWLYATSCSQFHVFKLEVIWWGHV